jgi:hypothetical protein
MPLPLMVRVDDDLAQKLRERAYVEHTPMNRIINDALRHYFEGLESGKAEAAPIGTAHDIVQTLRQKLKRAEDATIAPANQESDARRWKANSEFQSGILDCVTALMALHDPTIAPIVGDQAKSREKSHA